MVGILIKLFMDAHVHQGINHFYFHDPMAFPSVRPSGQTVHCDLATDEALRIRTLSVFFFFFFLPYATFYIAGEHFTASSWRSYKQLWTFSSVFPRQTCVFWNWPQKNRHLRQSRCDKRRLKPLVWQAYSRQQAGSQSKQTNKIQQINKQSGSKLAGHV